MPIDKDSTFQFQRAIDSAVFIRVARIAIVGATVVGLPIAGYGMKRLINRGDELATMAERTAIQMQLLEQSVRLTLDSRGREIDNLGLLIRDHETRIRAVERERQGGIGRN